jgi:hypothetical protein
VETTRATRKGTAGLVLTPLTGKSMAWFPFIKKHSAGGKKILSN